MDFLLMLVCDFIKMMLYGFAVSTLWGWFMVPTFGLPALGYAPAIGISLIVGLMTSEMPDEKKELGVKSFLTSLTAPIFTLVVGFIVHLFM